MKILNVVGARPNYMKIGPLIRELSTNQYPIEQVLVHTGQHYDINMSDIFFEQLNITAPDYFLNVGSASHATQTAKIMLEFEPILLKERPDMIVVVGDTNSALGAALVASKLNIPIAHIESGLRSGDREMPEEINRIIVDSISSLLFTPSIDANENLRTEGIPESKIHFVGNIMIDSLLGSIEMAKSSNIMSELALKEKTYALLTLHRPSNVDSFESLKSILETASMAAAMVPVVFPLHPRTSERIHSHKLDSYLENIQTIEPQGYIDFLSLISNAKLVMTDSGGIQEETTFLGVPCLTLRENTERPITVQEGTNMVVGLDQGKILTEVRSIVERENDIAIPKIEFWDGHTSKRILETLVAFHA